MIACVAMAADRLGERIMFGYDQEHLLSRLLHFHGSSQKAVRDQARMFLVSTTVGDVQDNGLVEWTLCFELPTPSATTLEPPHFEHFKMTVTTSKDELSFARVNPQHFPYNPLIEQWRAYPDLKKAYQSIPGGLAASHCLWRMYSLTNSHVAFLQSSHVIKHGVTQKYLIELTFEKTAVFISCTQPCYNTCCPHVLAYPAHGVGGG